MNKKNNVDNHIELLETFLEFVKENIK